MHRTVRRMAFLLTTIALAAPARGDVFLRYRRIIEGYEVKGAPVQPETLFTTLWFGPDRVRCDDGGVTIVDFRARTVYGIHHGEHAYTRMPLDSAAAHMRRALGRLDDSPALRAARAAMEALLRHGRMSASVRPRRETKGIKGLSCRRCEIARSGPDGAWSGDVWVTGAIPVDIHRLLIVRNVACRGLLGFDEAMAELARMEGVPVLEITTARVSGRHVISTEQLTDFGEKPAPCGVYDIPEEYNERPWTPALGGGGRE